MQFYVVDSMAKIDAKQHSIYLAKDTWNDFGFCTQFHMKYCDAGGVMRDVGVVKIARRPEHDEASGKEFDHVGLVPSEFTMLPETFFSLGQGEEYYEELEKVGSGVREAVLVALRDVAYFTELFDEVKDCEVTKKSLLRFVSAEEVVGQFARMARGLARLTQYAFSIDIEHAESDKESPDELTFSVVPESHPPSNIHVLISRNGVGKTTLLSRIAASMVMDSQEKNPRVRVRFHEKASPLLEILNDKSLSAVALSEKFANLVFISFSAFDSSHPIPNYDFENADMRFDYIGVKDVDANECQICNKDPNLLAKEFAVSLTSCLGEPRLSRLTRLLKTLQSDPVFSSFNMERYVQRIECLTRIITNIGVRIFQRTLVNVVLRFLNKSEEGFISGENWTRFADRAVAAATDVVSSFLDRIEERLDICLNAVPDSERSILLNELMFTVVNEIENKYCQVLTSVTDDEIDFVTKKICENNNYKSSRVFMYHLMHSAEVAEGIAHKYIHEDAMQFFSRLSSGHKIVLLTIVRLVQTVEEKTLVLFDEPEAHLHPPLLSSLIRCISDLLYERNGVAIMATHSPVVLQEVPKDCVWKISMIDGVRIARRPDRETFGENVGELTRDVFELEVDQSGFHSLLRKVTLEKKDYAAVEQYFDNKLGSEARAILRGFTFNEIWKDKVE